MPGLGDSAPPPKPYDAYTIARPLAEGQFGPPRPDRWEWRPSRRKQERRNPAQPREGSAFAALADLVR